MDFYKTTNSIDTDQISDNDINGAPHERRKFLVKTIDENQSENVLEMSTFDKIASKTNVIKPVSQSATRRTDKNSNVFNDKR